MTPNQGGRKYAMKGKKDKDVYLQAITIIDPATGWMEIHSVVEARADLVANQEELAWLTRYPLPDKITVDRGKELLAKFKSKKSTGLYNCEKDTKLLVILYERSKPKKWI